MSIFYVQQDHTVVMVNAEDKADAIIKAFGAASFQKGALFTVTALEDWKGVKHRDDNLIIGFAS
jgi:hypothetical protein